MSNFLIVGAILLLSGCILPNVISYTTCQKWSTATTSLIEGLSWSLPIFFVYWLTNSEYTKSRVLPLFSEPLGSELVGQIYVVLLMTCIVTARMFHTVDVASCVSTKDELKKFEQDLEKEIKKKQASK